MNAISTLNLNVQFAKHDELIANSQLKAYSTPRQQKPHNNSQGLLSIQFSAGLQARQ